jgi:3'-5' exoribonuclease
MNSKSRRFVSSLVDREKINEVFLLGDKQLRQNRNGNLYLQARLSDKTGAVNAMMWNASDRTGHDLHNGDYVRVDGVAQIFNGAIQIIISSLERIQEQDVDEADFIRISNSGITRMRDELEGILLGMSHPSLRSLAETFLADDTLMDQFVRAPAAIKNHHAYMGGLLEHVLSLMKLADSVARHYLQLNRDLLLFGVFLHDIGKVEELEYDRDLAYTDSGQLIGHVILGVEILDRKLQHHAQLTGGSFPEELAIQLKHLILSHHGKYEYGSPKLPMTLEAVTLHYLDDLDAKLHLIEGVIAEDANADSAWTPYQATLGRKLYKGSLGSERDSHS